MILRTIIFLIILGYFIKDYKEDKKKFKLLVLPIIALTYFGGTEVFSSLDSRFKLTIIIISGLLIMRTLYEYYKDYKKEKFFHVKEQRKIREQERLERDLQIIKDIEEKRLQNSLEEDKNQEVRKSSKIAEFEISFDNEDKNK